jgi:hypothetical protein
MQRYKNEISILDTRKARRLISRIARHRGIVDETEEKLFKLMDVNNTRGVR